MNRTLTAIGTTGAGLALVLGMTSPAHAATRATIDEARGDVRSIDGSGLSRAEKKIDMRGEIAFKTIEKGRTDLVTVRVKGQDFRGSGDQSMYLFTEKPNGTRFYVLSNMNGSKARVFDDSLARPERCTGGGVNADLRREVAVLRMPKRCLGGGDQVRVIDAGTVFARSMSFEAATAVDGRDSGAPTIDLSYR